ncbi:GLPGLI family protein [Sphingobacterium sp. PCS056]|uniref:GLPGLI family protein n=1 Tax=Sphingobacterium sp. PCS056 TaxID=2931400 RepID=UPI00200F9015|nr:GLPGLI family protein [Sphingobacterium sp. PCS056]UPZ35788.1 GLPGLI family protein [Sphingobacterium sp. PCS056]
MFRYIIIILFFLPFSLFSQKLDHSFKGKVLYNISFKLDSTSSRSYNEVAELLFNDSTSLFRSVNFGKRDSALYSLEKNGDFEGYSMSFFGETLTVLPFQILKQHNTIFTFQNLNAGNGINVFCYAEPSNSIEWKLIDSTKTIAGMHCQKAEGKYAGRNWEVWFTNEIPINDGPYKFSGLPGLVISAIDNTKTWKLECLKINTDLIKEVNLNRYLRTGIQKVSREAFLNEQSNAKKSYVQNRMIEFLSNNKSISDDEIKERKRNFQASVDSDNNWIELHP